MTIEDIEGRITELEQKFAQFSGSQEASDRKMRDLLMNLDDDNVPKLKSVSKLVSENGNAINNLTQEVNNFGVSMSSYLAYMMSGGYVVGEKSPTYGINDTSELPEGTFYYPTVQHNEGSVTFLTSNVYQWDGSVWSEYGNVTIAATVPASAASGDYWYCTADIEGDVDYYSDFLYRYDGTNWLYVGNSESDTSFMYSHLYQTVSDTEAQVGLVVGSGKLVSSGGTVSASVIVSTINNGSVMIDGSKVNITADNINLDGYLTVTNINSELSSNSTTIDGGLITTDSIAITKMVSAYSSTVAGNVIDFSNAGINFTSNDNYSRRIWNVYGINFFSGAYSAGVGYYVSGTNTNKFEIYTASPIEIVSTSSNGELSMINANGYGIKITNSGVYAYGVGGSTMISPT